jgi:hypothetical protein
MPKISITNRELDYGIYDADIFWVRQGILSSTAAAIGGLTSRDAAAVVPGDVGAAA